MRNEIIYSLLLITIIFNSCVELVKTGSPMYSSSISDSKENGSFIATYNISENILIHDSIEIKIKEAWTENIWYYKNQFKQIEVSNDTILLISIEINNEDYLSKAPSIINYTSESLIGMGFTSVGGNKLKLEFPQYDDEISIIFWKEKEIFLTKEN